MNPLRMQRMVEVKKPRSGIVSMNPHNGRIDRMMNDTRIDNTLFFSANGSLPPQLVEQLHEAGIVVVETDGNDENSDYEHVESSSDSVTPAKGNGKKYNGRAGAYVVLPIGSSLEEVEKILIERTLAMVGNNKSKTAKILGLSRKTIHNKLRHDRQNREQLDY